MLLLECVSYVSNCVRKKNTPRTRLVTPHVVPHADF